MKTLSYSLIVIFTAFFSSCADDIKGDKGDPGLDATATALIGLRRPDYQSSSLSNTTIVVPATAAKPAQVLIDNVVYANSTDAGCDVMGSLRGGIDTGDVAASTAYYLYAIPAESGTTFDLVASVAPPDTGPTDFPAWTYIGAFITNSGETIEAFSSSNGFLIIQGSVFSTSTTTTTTYEKKTLSPYPVTVKEHWGRVNVNGTVAGGLARVAGSNVGAPYEAVVVRLQVTTVENWAYGFVPATDNLDIWVQADNINNTARWIVYGWVEDPAEWP